MLDSRLHTLAQILVTQSLDVKKSEKVSLRLAGLEGLPLARACYESIINAGGHPHFQASDEYMDEYFFAHANDEQIAAQPDLALHHAHYFDKNLTIVAESNVNNLTNIESDKLLARSRLTHPIKKVIMSKPFVLTYYPTSALAQAAHMSVRELENYIFTATNQDWFLMSQYMHRLAKKLTHKKIRLIGKKTDLTLDTKGRKWITDDWKANMPGGEVFTSPILESVNGHIYFDFPLSRHGKTMSDIYLEFKNGKIIQVSANNNQKFLQTLLATDEFAPFVGEIAIGLNKGCTRYLDNILFDEKMAGTIHLALGAGFPECGQPCNHSALHLDIVKDMRLPGSQIWANDELILEEGKLLIK